jgi:hypothetical protein
MMGTSLGTTAGGVWNQLLRRATWEKRPHNKAVVFGLFWTDHLTNFVHSWQSWACV